MKTSYHTHSQSECECERFIFGILAPILAPLPASLPIPNAQHLISPPIECDLFLPFRFPIFNFIYWLILESTSYRYFWPHSIIYKPLSWLILCERFCIHNGWKSGDPVFVDTNRFTYRWTLLYMSLVVICTYNKIRYEINEIDRRFMQLLSTWISNECGQSCGTFSAICGFIRNCPMNKWHPYDVDTGTFKRLRRTDTLIRNHLKYILKFIAHWDRIPFCVCIVMQVIFHYLNLFNVSTVKCHKN